MILSKQKYPNSEAGATLLAETIIGGLGDIAPYRIKDVQNVSSIFLAGAPGAGKSEFLETILVDLKRDFIVIDIDQYRSLFEGYNGENASEFQTNSVKVANKILKFCFHNNLNFIFDGTFRSYEKVRQNLEQCIHYQRNTMVTLVYQEPKISFYYTFLRKIYKTRNVPVEVFIDGFYSSVENVFRAQDEFDVFLFIASKTYQDIDNRKFTYKIHDDIRTLQSFCKKFRIGYTEGVFTNKEKLTFDIESFQSTLIANYRGNGGLISRLKLWFFKIVNNHIGI